MEKVQSKAEDYRYERKIIVSEITKYQIESIIKLHPAIFSEIYAERFVNNIYFDCLNMKNYFANIDGIKNRLKVRIRWYGDLFGLIEKPYLEIKIKDGLVGRKERFLLNAIVIDENLTSCAIVSTIQESDVPDIVKEELLSLKITVLNRYCRKYFLSINRKYRLTLDSDLEFYRVGVLDNTFVQKSVDHQSSVIELKYDQADDDHVNWLFNYLPFRISKNSKYVTGIERLYS